MDVFKLGIWNALFSEIMMTSTSDTNYKGSEENSQRNGKMALYVYCTNAYEASSKGSYTTVHVKGVEC